ncbi:hypothetical protein B0H67DRAFT_558868 [Lasiosphaeris hirsuta]|uniref:Uncharacterized protein n=1 Tax=Lasiosphaeris hirsuta TaxID=260670 RepID=A0AA40B896_9PEZI|nr:hypothetical protein B0H67DRAFT_558868 [Lasiosphaeris hirsuta]
MGHHRNSDRRYRRGSKSSEHDQTPTRHKSNRNKRDSAGAEYYQESLWCAKQGCDQIRHINQNQKVQRDFCLTHWWTCENRSCFEETYVGAEGRSKYCPDHKCQQRFCNGGKDGSGVFCSNHTCDLGPCQAEGANQSTEIIFCKEHRCLSPGCNGLAMRFEGFNANQQQMSPSQYCSDHACQEPGCVQPGTLYDKNQQSKCASHFWTSYSSQEYQFPLTTASNMSLNDLQMSRVPLPSQVSYTPSWNLSDPPWNSSDPPWNSSDPPWNSSDQSWGASDAGSNKNVGHTYEGKRFYCCNGKEGKGRWSLGWG